MNPILGWLLAAVFTAVAWRQYGWQGVLFAATAIVFWLLLQFNRAIRVMKDAGGSPVGSVGSAVMLHAKLRRGMTMLQIVTLTKSLGRRVQDTPEVWQWRDDGGASVEVTMDGAKVASWTLARPTEPAAADTETAR